MSQQIAIRIPAEVLAELDQAVADGRFDSRAAAVREGITLLMRVQREGEIAAEYRRGYGDQPQETWVGDAGLALGAAIVRRERDRTPR